MQNSNYTPPQTPCYPTIQLDRTLPFFTLRNPQSHKGSYGTLLLICGTKGMLGAAAMAAKAALRCGVGLVNVVVRQSCYPILAPLLPEAVFTILDDATLDAVQNGTLTTPQGTVLDGTSNDAPHAALCTAPNSDATATADKQTLLNALHKASACVIGCGLGGDAAWYLPIVFSNATCPIVADADALNFLTQHPQHFQTAHAPLLLTPHPAEMARLCQTTTQAVQNSRIQTAIAFAQTHHAYTILKGSNTVVATPSGDASINPTGNAGMAKGGSGDVLAGILGAFLAQEIAPEAAAQAAVYIHGAVGDACAKTLSQTAMQPTDMIAALPTFFKQLQPPAL